MIVVSCVADDRNEPARSGGSTRLQLLALYSSSVSLWKKSRRAYAEDTGYYDWSSPFPCTSARLCL